jgi:hypothetical protein
MPNEVMFICRDCWREGHVSQLALIDRTAEAQYGGHEVDVAYEHVCQRCGNVAGISLDYGTLDLGLVTDEQLRPDDFEVLE